MPGLSLQTNVESAQADQNQSNQIISKSIKILQIAKQKLHFKLDMTRTICQPLKHCLLVLDQQLTCGNTLYAAEQTDTKNSLTHSAFVLTKMELFTSPNHFKQTWVTSYTLQ